MQQLFLNQEPINNTFIVTGDDAHHLIRVVRINAGEKLRISTDTDSFLCAVTDVNPDSFTAEIIEEVPSTELDNKIYLFQAIPKGDRIETIIEKCTELGVYEIIPVEMKNCIAKYDDKKKPAKIKRFSAIAEAAAKQSKRSQIPRIHDIMTYKDALEYARSCDIRLLPYESKNGMEDTKTAFAKIKKGMSIAVIIGPEGGFATSEVQAAESDFDIISLGNRILRTDTAAICTLSLLSVYSDMN